MSRPRPFPAFFLLFATVCLVAAGCSKEPPPKEPQLAPDFTLSDTSGNQVSLSKYRGDVVLLDFWATWCPPCRVAIPHLVELQRKYRSAGLTVLGMNMDQDGEEVAAFLSQQSVNYPILRVDEKTRLAYGGVSSIPQAVLIDRKGFVRKKFMGFDNRIGEEMEELVQTLVQEGQGGG